MVGDLPPGRLPGLGLTLRALRLVCRPSELALVLRIGCFLWRIPTELERRPMPALLARLGAARRPRTGNIASSLARVGRARDMWLRLPRMRSRNTCYTRAFVLFRFVDSGGRMLHIHLGVEPGVDPGDRLRGHAWVTVDGQILEAPDAVVAGRVREIYCYPPLDSSTAVLPSDLEPCSA